MSNLLNIKADEILTLFRKHFPELPDDMEQKISAILTTEPPPELNTEISLSETEQPQTLRCAIIEGYNNVCRGSLEPETLPHHLASTGTIASANYDRLFSDTRHLFVAANLALTGVLFYDDTQQDLLGIYTGSAIASDDLFSFTLKGGWDSAGEPEER